MSGQKITGRQRDELARFLLSIRSDWSKHYTVDALAAAEAISDDLESLVRVAVRCAMSPNVRKPDVIAMNGEHWKAATEPGRVDPPRGNGRCPDCKTFHARYGPCEAGAPPAADPVGRAAELRSQLRPMRRFEAKASADA